MSKYTYDLTLIVISRPGYHTVLVQGPARTKLSSLARKYAKGGDSCVYSRARGKLGYAADDHEGCRYLGS